MEASIANGRGEANPLLGCAITSRDVGDPLASRLAAQRFELIVPEYELKWDHFVRSGDLAGADLIDLFARAHGQLMRGHTIWWHEAIPEGAQRWRSTRFVNEALDWLSVVCRRYAGRIHSWDVVNEPLDARGCLRDTPFLRAFGPDYISVAFRRAAELDPGALLVLNEMGLEYRGCSADAKRQGMLALLKRELSRGTPIHCLGLQSHIDTRDPTASELAAFLREIQELGLSCMITEFDVAGSSCDAELAGAYAAHARVVAESCRLEAVVVWGLMDDRSWLGQGRPLLFDSEGREKPSLTSLMDSIGRKGREIGRISNRTEGAGAIGGAS